MDDDENIADLLGLVLASAGYKVDKRYGGQEAIDFVEGQKPEERPDLVLSDIMMPEIDGYQVLDRFKEIGYTGPVILMTAAPSRETINEARTRGAANYLAKPFDIWDIPRFVAEQLKRSREVSV